MRSRDRAIDIPIRDAQAPAIESAIRGHWADRLARLAWLALVALIGFGLLAGSIIAVIHRPGVDWTVYNLPYMVQNLGYLLVLVLSLPSLAIGGWDLIRGRRGRGGGRLLAFFGPLLVILGSEGLVSHLVLGCAVNSWACADGDFTVRWHQLHHTLVAGLPLAVFYWLALRKWHPAIARFGRPGGLMAVSVGRWIMSPSKLPVERIAGILLLPIIPLMVVGVVLDPGLDSRAEYFAESFARFVPQRGQALVSTALLFAVGLTVLAAASALALAFRPYRSRLATASAVGLLAAGVLIVSGAGAGLRLHQLASEWPTLSGAAADQVARSALTAQDLRVGLLFLGLPLLLASLLAWGLVIHRRSRLPRWLLGLPALGGAIIVLSPLGFLDVFNTGFGGFLMIGGLVLFSWLLVEAGWLVVRGRTPPPVSSPA